MRTFILILVGITFANSNAQSELIIKEQSLKAHIAPDKTLVVCLSPLDEFRRPFELEMKEQLEFHGIHAETSKKYLPFTLTKTARTLQRLTTLFNSLSDEGFNQLLISTLTDTENTKVNAEGDWGDFQLFHFETNLYTMNGNDSTLIWSMCLCIFDYQFSTYKVKDFVKAIIQTLINDGLLKESDIKGLKLYTV